MVTMFAGEMGGGRQVQDLVYTPAKGAPQRTLGAERGTTALFGRQPVLLIDRGFLWTQPDYEDFVDVVGKKIAAAAANEADPLAHAGKAAFALADWLNLRGGAGKYGGTGKKGDEGVMMVGALVAQITCPETATAGCVVREEVVVSLAPNMLAGKTGWAVQARNKQAGGQSGQVHAEQFFYHQLTALATALASSQRRQEKRMDPQTYQYSDVPAVAGTPGGLTLDVTMLIEFNAMCDGCQGTWKDWPSVEPAPGKRANAYWSTRDPRKHFSGGGNNV